MAKWYRYGRKMNKLMNVDNINQIIVDEERLQLQVEFDGRTITLYEPTVTTTAKKQGKIKPFDKIQQLEEELKKIIG